MILFSKCVFARIAYSSFYERCFFLSFELFANTRSFGSILHCVLYLGDCVFHFGLHLWCVSCAWFLTHKSRCATAANQFTRGLGFWFLSFKHMSDFTRLVIWSFPHLSDSFSDHGFTSLESWTFLLASLRCIPYLFLWNGAERERMSVLIGTSQLWFGSFEVRRVRLFGRGISRISRRTSHSVSHIYKGKCSWRFPSDCFVLLVLWDIKARGRR